MLPAQIASIPSEWIWVPVEDKRDLKYLFNLISYPLNTNMGIEVLNTVLSKAHLTHSLHHPSSHRAPEHWNPDRPFTIASLCSWWDNSMVIKHTRCTIDLSSQLSNSFRWLCWLTAGYTHPLVCESVSRNRLVCHCVVWVRERGKQTARTDKGRAGNSWDCK